MGGAQAVVPRMVHKDARIAAMCCGAVRDLVRGHDRTVGALLREAVQLVADLVRQSRCKCPPAVLESLLVLSLGTADVAPPSLPGRPLPLRYLLYAGETHLNHCSARAIGRLFCRQRSRLVVHSKWTVPQASYFATLNCQTLSRAF